MNTVVFHIVTSFFVLVIALLLVVAVSRSSFGGKHWIVAALSLLLACNVAYKCVDLLYFWDALDNDFMETWRFFSFRLWVPMLVGWLLFIPFLLRVSAKRDKSANGDLGLAASASRVQAESIGGWLIFPAIGLLLSPLMIVGRIVFSWKTLHGENAESMENQFPGFKYSVEAEIWTDIVLLIYVLFVAVVFYSRKNSAPTLIIIMIGANLLLSLINLGILMELFAERGVPLAAKNLFFSVISSAIWIPYFLVSKRVKRTFVT